jgi:hypothetical protein
VLLQPLGQLICRTITDEAEKKYFFLYNRLLASWMAGGASDGAKSKLFVPV